MKSRILLVGIILAIILGGCKSATSSSSSSETIAKGIPVPILAGKLASSIGVKASIVPTKTVISTTGGVASPGLSVDATLYGSGTNYGNIFNSAMDRFIFPIAFDGFSTSQTAVDGDVLHYGILADSNGNTIPVSVAVSVDSSGNVTYTGTFDDVNSNSGFILTLDTAGNWTFNYNIYFDLFYTAQSLNVQFYSWASLSGTANTSAATATGSGQAGYVCTTSASINLPCVMGLGTFSVNQTGTTAAFTFHGNYYGDVSGQPNDVLDYENNSTFQNWIVGLINGTLTVVNGGYQDLNGYTVTITSSGVSGFPF